MIYNSFAKYLRPRYPLSPMQEEIILKNYHSQVNKEHSHTCKIHNVLRMDTYIDDFSDVFNNYNAEHNHPYWNDVNYQLVQQNNSHSAYTLDLYKLQLWRSLHILQMFVFSIEDHQPCHISCIPELQWWRFSSYLFGPVHAAWRSDFLWIPDEISPIALKFLYSKRLATEFS